MKKIIFSAVVLFVFSLSMIVFQISCNKSSVAQRPSDCVGPQPKLQFVANGVTYNCDGVWDARFGWVNFPYFIKSIRGVDNTPYYNLYAENLNSPYAGDDPGHFNVFPNNQYQCRFYLDFNNVAANLTVGSYSVGTQITLYDKVNRTEIGCETGSRPINTFQFNITRISNGSAFGNFSGYIDCPFNSSPRITITDGAFENIPIF